MSRSNGRFYFCNWDSGILNQYVSLQPLSLWKSEALWKVSGNVLRNVAGMKINSCAKTIVFYGSKMNTDTIKVMVCNLWTITSSLLFELFYALKPVPV